MNRYDHAGDASQGQYEYEWPWRLFPVALPLACQEVKLSKRSTVAKVISKRKNRSSINSYCTVMYSVHTNAFSCTRVG